MTEANKKLLNQLKKLNEKTGAGLKLASELKNTPLLDTPFPTLNTIIGGIPFGKFTTVAGKQHSGKGAFCAQLVAHHMQQNPDFIVLWSDLENSLDYDWLTTLGVDLDRVIVQKYTRELNTMEKVLDNALTIIKETNLINMWVLDSIGALLPKADIYSGKDKERSLEEANMLNLQRKLGEFFRKANSIVSPDEASGYEGCAVICISHVYDSPDQYAGPQVKGGNAFMHWAHLRLMLDRAPKAYWPAEMEITGIDGNKKKIRPGWAGKFKIDKTRINQNEGQDVILTFMLGRGFDSEDSLISAAFGLNVFERAGPTYKCELLPEGKIKGKDALISYFKENKEAFEKLKDLVNQKALEQHVEHEEIKKPKQETELL